MKRDTSHSALLRRLLTEIRTTAKKASIYRLAGQINRATALESVVDVLVKRAEKAGHGDEAFLAEQDGQQAARSGRDPGRKKSNRKSLIQKTGEPFKGFSIAYSPVNQAWFVLFGRGPVHTRSVIRIVPTKKEALAIMRHATSGTSTNDPGGRPKRRSKHGRARIRAALARKRSRRDPSSLVAYKHKGKTVMCRKVGQKELKKIDSLIHKAIEGKLPRRDPKGGYEAHEIVFETPAMWRWFKHMAAQYPDTYGHATAEGGWMFPSDPRKGRIADTLRAGQGYVMGVRRIR